MLSILFVTYGWKETGGGTVFPRAVAMELACRGYDLSVFYASLRTDPFAPAFELEKHIEEGVRLYGVYNRPALFIDPDHPEREMDDPLIKVRFCQVLEEVQPDLVHFHNFHGLTLSLAEETFMRGIPSCYTPHNYHLIDPELYLLKNGLEQWGSLDLLVESDAVARNPEKRDLYQQRATVARQLANQWVNLILAVSQREKELLCRFGIEAKRIAVLHQVMPETDTLWSEAGDEVCVSDHTSRPLRIAVLGGLLAIKGVHLAVAACQTFTADDVELHLFGFINNDYYELLQQLDRKSLCRFHGPYNTADLALLAKRIDIGLVPSIVEESAPTLVLAELQAMRIPVIAARIGGIPEFITEGVDGFLYRHDDINELAALIRRCLEEPDLIKKMRRNLTAPVQTFSRYMECLEKVYSVLLTAAIPDVDTLSCLAIKRDSEDKQPAVNPLIHWQGGLFVHHSLALVNRELCLQLLDRNFKISFETIVPDQFEPGDDPRMKRLASIRNLPIKQPNITIRHFWPPDFSRPASGKLVVIQPWEYGSIPVAWVGQINRNVDQLWVPSSFVRDCYIKGGVVADKVKVVPNGVAVERFNPQAAPLELPTSKGFRFLFVGGTIHRKGIDLLLAAYADAFTAADDVCLVIKEMGSSSIYQGQTAQEMIAAFQQVAHHPDLLYLKDDIDDSQMSALYTACHCLVHPYRGEGFGLPIAEAMACGLAPIVTGYGAALDFCPPEIAWLIPAVEQRLPEKRISNLETVDYPWLAEPDLATLTEMLRHAYSRQEEVISRGRAAAVHIREQFSWHKAADIADKYLNSLLNAATSPPDSEPEKPVVPTETGLLTQRQQKSCAKARKLAGRGEIEKAVQLLLEDGIRPDSTATEPYCALAEILLTAGHYQDALEVIAEMPPTADPAYRCELEVMAVCALGEDERALQLAVKVAARPRVQVALGTIAARRGALADAEECFRLALAQDPGCASALLSLGMLLWGQGKQLQAWQTVKQAVIADPLQQAGFQLLADMAQRLNRLPEASALLGQLREQYPDYRLLAHQHILLLAEDHRQQGALTAIEAFLAAFGIEEELLKLGLELRKKLGPKLIASIQRNPTISLCMIVKNEETFLPGCLHSVQPVVDELVLLDTGSTDRTVEAATLFGARVEQFSWNGSFSEARNAALERANGDWILIMDADERISAKDHQTILDTVSSSAPTDAWSVLIRTYSNRVQVQGWTANDGSYPDEEELDGWYPASRVRLFPNHPAIRYEGVVHELLEPSLRRLGFNIRTPQFVVHHYAEVSGLPENLRLKQIRYYELGKQKLAENPDDLPCLFELAVQAGELELYDEALQLWDRLLVLCPGQLDALFNKGHVLMALKRYKEARDVSKSVLDKEPDNREAAFNYATCELYTGDAEQAYGVVAVRLARDRSYPLLLALQTMLGLATGRIAEACCCYADLLAQQYDIQGYLEKRLITLQELGRHELVKIITKAAESAFLKIGDR